MKARDTLAAFAALALQGSLNIDDRGAIGHRSWLHHRVFAVPSQPPGDRAPGSWDLFGAFVPDPDRDLKQSCKKSGQGQEMRYPSEYSK